MKVASEPVDGVNVEHVAIPNISQAGLQRRSGSILARSVFLKDFIQVNAVQLSAVFWALIFS